MATHILKINLISAQGLKLQSSSRQMRTYALAWVDPDTKLRSRVDRIGADNPTWNDMFFFKVTSGFLSSETSSLSIEIYAVGYLRDNLIGTARFLIGNIPLSATMKTPSFTAVQIRRPSGRCQGLLNIGAMLIDGSDIAALDGVSAIGYRDLMGESPRGKHDGGRIRKSKSIMEELSNLGAVEDDSAENSPRGGGSPNSTASSSSNASTALKELSLNGSPKLPPKNRIRSASDGVLCGLITRSASGHNIAF
ncbi:hypothetical protein ACOSP7_000895 [Xanthoceras sorbifolium]|uniref:C2 domain-containing protein n=1 Tax=Xanthoceras sorbifolium TaxID=99658 RepID=A0ABQ8INA4_9ROSI|nr:hypothetical protein JRO89_XS01G0326600 [Xanthoceras sorbifolium]